MDIEIEKLPLHLKKEWYHVKRWHSIKSKDEIWVNFKKFWEISFLDDVISLGVIAKEISEMEPAVYEQWRIWTKIGYKFHDQMVSSLNGEMLLHDIIDVDLSKILESFKIEWDWDNPATSVMFTEMGYLSGGLLNE